MNTLENTVQSPCVRNCCLNDDDMCIGCFRTLQEIMRWGNTGDRERTIILEHCRQRREIYLYERQKRMQSPPQYDEISGLTPPTKNQD